MVTRKPKISNLLFDEPPLIVIPSLAVMLGLHEAIFLQQIHYWLKGNSGAIKNGRRWVYNTRKEWQVQFPFWSVDTIGRAAESLKKKGILLTTNEYNKSTVDRTLWYSIDYEALQHYAESQNGAADAQNVESAKTQNGTAKTRDAFGKYANSNHETTQENSTETIQEISSATKFRAQTSPREPTSSRLLAERHASK